MPIRLRARGPLLGGLLLTMMMAASQASAVPMVTFTKTPIGGGLFQYVLTLDNDAGAEPLSGLNILNANTVFGLDQSSVISAPAGWGSFAPLPPVVDELNFFSLSGGSDIAIDASLSGFSFQSSVSLGSFSVEAIGGTTSMQIALPDAIPEPSTGLLVAAGLAAQAALRRPRSRFGRG